MGVIGEGDVDGFGGFDCGGVVEGEGGDCECHDDSVVASAVEVGRAGAAGMDDEAVGELFGADAHFCKLFGHALDSVGFLGSGLGDIEQGGLALCEAGGDGHCGQCVGGCVHIDLDAL